MQTKISLRNLPLISLTTLLLLDLYPAGNLLAGNRNVSSQAARPTNEKSSNRRDEFTSTNNAQPAAVAKGHPALAQDGSSSCPPPTEKQGNQCVLTADAVLEQTLILPSDTRLDCHGHKLTAKVPAPASSDPSQPQVGIFLNDVRNVRIHKCVIDGFDFGVFAINSKPTKQPAPGAVKSIEMKGNIIKSRYTAVSLNSVDDAELVNNHITHTRAAGKGLYIGRDSDANKVVNNTFVAGMVGIPNAFRVPGTANPVAVAPAAAVMVTQIEGPEPTLLNAVVEGKLYQLTTTNSLVPNSDFSEGNRIEGNTIIFSGVPVDGIALPVPQATLVIGNKVTGGSEAAIRVGMQNNASRVFPGHCTLEESRLCLDDSICKIFDVDKGTCTPRETRTVSWVSHDTRIEDNVINGPLGTGIATTGLRTIITGNTVVGPLINAKTGGGIRLVTKHALETTTLMRNSVSNVAVVFSLIQELQGLQPLSFTSKVSLNDFTDYSIAVLSSRTGSLAQTNPADVYTLLSELSVAGRGNFWGTGCDVGLNPTTVQKIDGSPNPAVTDSHPYQVPVAKTPVTLLPNPCR